jgi:2-(1,2-epoxy-1,2-dihydrophenyl)acetyl-CoA isomerase
MSYQHLDYSVHEHVARITINRPKAYNAIDLDSAQELYDIANRCSSDKAVRAVVLTGSGAKAFCAGGDVAAFASDPEGVALLLKRMTGYLHMAISRLAWMDAPVIAAVNGVAAGAGLSLAAACDLAIAADNASFTSAYTLIGQRRTMELYLTNRVLKPAEALDWGLVNQVVPSDQLTSTVDELAARLAHGPTGAHGAVKKLMRMSFNDTLESQMERETRHIVALGQTDDGREGVRAFVDKRKPRFGG